MEGRSTVVRKGGRARGRGARAGSPPAPRGRSELGLIASDGSCGWRWRSVPRRLVGIAVLFYEFARRRAVITDRTRMAPFNPPACRSSCGFIRVLYIL